MLTTVALVDHERTGRTAGLASMAGEIEQLRAEVGRLEGLVARFHSDFAPIEGRVTLHTDLVVGEALRQAEETDGRLATEHQRLADLVARLDREHTAVVHLLSGDKPLDAGLAASLPPAAMAGDGTSRMLFEEVERGSREEVGTAFREYLPLFVHASPIVDLGCGRGEFLELALLAGLDAYGVDLDPAAVERCEAAGLRVVPADLYEHLMGAEAESLGGVFCAQVVEHLPPGLLEPLMGQIGRVLRGGGRVVIETPNAASFSTYVHSFWRDPTHLRPVPAPRLVWVARTAGLVVEEVRYSSPPPVSERLTPAGFTPGDPELAAAVRAYDTALGRLNGLLYGPMDVALVATKPG
jgi:O-antigen chain-terminating methyltransferase